jgi:hypothetical protein
MSPCRIWSASFAATSSARPGVLLLLAGLYTGFIGWIILKYFHDVRGDALFGKRTFLVRHGRRWTCAFSAWCWAAGTVIVAGAVPRPTAALALAYTGFLAGVLCLLRTLAAAPGARRDECVIADRHPRTRLAPADPGPPVDGAGRLGRVEVRRQDRRADPADRWPDCFDDTPRADYPGDYPRRLGGERQLAPSPTGHRRRAPHDSPTSPRTPAVAFCLRLGSRAPFAPGFLCSPGQRTGCDG